VTCHSCCRPLEGKGYSKSKDGRKYCLDTRKCLYTARKRLGMSHWQAVQMERPGA
jgi:hypothetical protein